MFPDFREHLYFGFSQAKPTTWHHPRKPQPKDGSDRLKLYLKPLSERRNMVKMPSIATGSLVSFFKTSWLALYMLLHSGPLIDTTFLQVWLSGNVSRDDG